MHFDFSALSAKQRYKLLVSTIVPRPIALVTTIGADGQANAAPFSFFNVFSDAPPLVILGISGREPAQDGDKDTVRNIKATGEFVVNLVDTALLAGMNICGADFAPEVDELEIARLSTRPSRHVAPPCIAEAPVSFECREWQRIPIGDAHRTLVIGEVLGMTARDGIISPETLRVDIDALDLVGRLHGGGWYLRLTDRIQMERATPDTVGTQTPAPPEKSGR